MLLQLCIRPLESALPNGCKNCTVGFAYAASGTAPLTALKDVLLTARDNAFCGTVTKGGYYAVAKLLLSASAVRMVASWALLLVLLAWIGLFL